MTKIKMKINPSSTSPTSRRQDKIPKTAYEESSQEFYRSTTLAKDYTGTASYVLPIGYVNYKVIDGIW